MHVKTQVFVPITKEENVSFFTEEVPERTPQINP